MRTFSIRGGALAPLTHALAKALFGDARPIRVYGGGLSFDPQLWRALPEVPGGLLVIEFEDAWLHVDQASEVVSGNVALPSEPAACLKRLHPCPWESATLGAAHPSWTHRDYAAPHYLPALGLGGGHIQFGRAAAFRGDGRARLASPRLLTHGPWRTAQADDAVFIQFHAPDADASDALAQAGPGHQLLSTAWLGEAPVLSKGIRGTWFAADQSLRITWAEARPPYPREMLTAVALGRASERPVSRVDFVFLEQRAAEAAHVDLWLRGLGCRVINDMGQEIDLGEPPIARPDWIG